MKKWLALALAAVLLAGCLLFRPVHHNPAPMSAGEPVGNVGNLWKIPQKTLERLGPRQMLGTEEGLLVVGDGKLLLLSEEDFSVQAEQTAAAGSTAYAQSLAEGFCLIDPENGRITVLSGRLETRRVLETEPGDFLYFLSPDGQRLYTVTDTELRLDGELLRAFRSLTVMEMGAGWVTLRAVGTEDLVTRFYVLDLDTGILSEETGSRQQARWRNLLVAGDGWLRCGSGELLLYDENGAFVSSTRLPETTGSSAGLVWSDRWQGWLFLYRTPEKTCLMFWDPAPLGEAEPIDILPGTVPAGELLQQSLYDRAAELSDRFSVDIRIGERAVREYDSYTAEVLEDPELTVQALDILETALSLYPEGFLAQLPFDEVGTIRIEIVDSLKQKKDAEDAIDTSAFAQERTGYYLLVFNARRLRESMVYHELSHIIDKRLDWEARFREDALYSEESWMALQPEGFEYAGSYNNIPDSVKKYYDSGYFVRDYSCVSASEDRAMMLEKAILGERQVFEENPGLMPKLRYYCGCIRDSFDTDGWPETVAWERLLGEG